MKHIFFILLMGFTSHIFSQHLLAQINNDKELSFYDEINASKNAKKYIDFNLKGKVKSLVEITETVGDSTFFNFNPNGFLVKQFNNKTKKISTYSFEKNLLKYVYIEEPEQRTVYKKYFNSLGFIQKEIIESTNYTDTFLQEKNYVFNSNFDNLNIHYTYNIDTTDYDVVLHDNIVFTFNNRKQIIRERWLSKHTEYSYGFTANYQYDSLTNNLIYLTKIADCAFTPSSNSCANLTLEIVYDNRNNIISKSLIDNTIRNSFDSHSYHYSFKYNNNNDIIEEYSLSAARYIRDLSTETKEKTEMKVPTFEYEYDNNGNWVKKYQITNNNRKLIKTRIFEYYK